MHVRIDKIAGQVDAEVKLENNLFWEIIYHYSESTSKTDKGNYFLSTEAGNCVDNISLK